MRQQKVRMKKSIFRSSFFSIGSTVAPRRYVIKLLFAMMTAAVYPR